MRKRWKVGDGLWEILFGVWVIGWLPISLVLGALTMPCDRTGACGLDSSAPGWHPFQIFLVAWFGVVVVPAALVGICFLAVALWSARPRRVLESVEDIREHYREP